MDAEHIKKLNSNRVLLVQNIHSISSILDILKQEGVLTDGMLEDIDAKSTKFNKIRALLDIIIKRYKTGSGKNVYYTFVDALRQTGNNSIADTLLMGEEKKKYDQPLPTQVSKDNRVADTLPTGKEKKKYDQPLPTQVSGDDRVADTLPTGKEKKKYDQPLPTQVSGDDRVADTLPTGKEKKKYDQPSPTQISGDDRVVNIDDTKYRKSID
jgi:hypothetical protein